MTTLADLEALLEPALTLLAIADWHEDRGEARLAPAYRWLAARGKCPRPLRDGLMWWMITDSRANRDDLPRGAYPEMGYGASHDSHAEAYRWAAEHLAALAEAGEIDLKERP